MTGTGITQPKRDAYKVQPDGRFGNVQIDLPNLLYHHKLKVYNGEGILMDKKAPIDLVELLTKRYNPRTNYSDKSIKTFQDLVKLSGLPVHSGSGKFHLLKKKERCDNKVIRIIQDPNDLIERMSVLIGEIAAGNDSDIVKNELSDIADILLNKNIILSEQHKDIFEKYLSIIV